MAKRLFLQKAHTYDGQGLSNWYASEKLDGQRCFWDGGISTGMPASEVPWANTAKDGRLKTQVYATGLWSMNAKVIHAPEEWYSTLPRLPLDGELYAGIGKTQFLSTIIRRHSADVDDWINHVTYYVFDIVPYTRIFSPGSIDTQFYQKIIGADCLKWAITRGEVCRLQGFESAYKRLKSMDFGPSCKLATHEQLPAQTQRIQEKLDEMLDSVVEKGGEGIIARNPIGTWRPERSRNVLKIKPCMDSEAVVIGHTKGKGRHLGRMGALIVKWKGKSFELSGMTDAERENPAEIGSTVTFKYRGVTDFGIPKEARYWRLRYDE